MTARRAVVGLSLLCALSFSAFAAQSASATKGTTAFPCTSSAGIDDFSDAHCDSGVEKGSYGHVYTEPGQEVEIELTNSKTKTETKESTPAILKGTLAGVKFETACTTVSGTGKSTNKVIAEVMQNEGTGLAIKYTGCTVNKPAGCKVKEPIEITGSSITVENLGVGKTDMGVQFKPKAEKPFGEVTLEGTECALKGKSFAIEGTMIATGSRGSTESVTSSGATLVFTNEMTKETLKFGGKEAEFSSTMTLNMKEEGVGLPLSFTTDSGEEKIEECIESEWPEEECSWSSEVSEEELENAFEEEVEWTEEKAEAGIDPVLFVHGYKGDGSTFRTMVKAFEKAGYKPGWLYNWSYPYWESNTKIAEKIKKIVEGLLAATGRSHVDIVAHSMGGLASRYYMKELKGWGNIGQWAAIASPNFGTEMANNCKYPSCIEMRPGSTFLKKLNTAPMLPGGGSGPQYATWRSGTGFFGGACDTVITPPASAEVAGMATNTVAKCLTHSGMHEDATVIKEVREFVEK